MTEDELTKALSAILGRNSEESGCLCRRLTWIGFCDDCKASSTKAFEDIVQEFSKMRSDQEKLRAKVEDLETFFLLLDRALNPGDGSRQP